MPNRARNGLVSRPLRVVAPTRVKGVEVELYRPCTGALVYHDVDAKIFHGRVEVLLHHGTKAVYLVDEKHVVGF